MKIKQRLQIWWHKQWAEYCHEAAMETTGLYWQEQRSKFAERRDYHMDMIIKLSQGVTQSTDSHIPFLKFTPEICERIYNNWDVVKFFRNKRLVFVEVDGKKFLTNYK